VEIGVVQGPSRAPPGLGDLQEGEPPPGAERPAELDEERGWIDEEALDKLRGDVKTEVEDAIEFAEQSEPPPWDALYEDITIAPFIPQE